MGFFSSIVIRWQIRRLKKSFSKYVDPSIIDAVLRDPETLATPAIRRCEVDFVLVLVQDEDDLENLPERLRKVVDALHGSPAILEHLAGSLGLITFGAGFRDDNIPADSIARHRSDLVARLMETLAGEIKILHGRTAALVGDFGSGAHVRYGSAFQGLGGLLRTLTSMQFGESREL